MTPLLNYNFNSTITVGKINDNKTFATVCVGVLKQSIFYVQNRRYVVSDLMNEIKQELKEEKYAALWKKYQNHIYSVILAVLVVTAGVSFWNRYQEGRRQEVAATYFNALQALEHKDQKIALNLLDEIPAQNRGGYKDLSRFLAAALLQEQGKEDAARDVYQNIIDDTGMGDTYKNMAIIRMAYMDIENQKPEDLLKLVQPLVKKDSAWEASAVEIVGLLKVQQDKKDEAIKEFEKIDGMEKASKYAKFRAKAMIKSLKGND